MAAILENGRSEETRRGKQWEYLRIGKYSPLNIFGVIFTDSFAFPFTPTPFLKKINIPYINAAQKCIKLPIQKGYHTFFYFTYTKISDFHSGTLPPQMKVLIGQAHGLMIPGSRPAVDIFIFKVLCFLKKERLDRHQTW